MSYPTTSYGLTDEDYEALLDACKPTPAIKIGNYTGSTPQENANRAWAALGAKMGFDSTTVRPIPGKGDRFFTAVPSETHEAKVERVNRETLENQKREAARLREEIADRQRQLNLIESGHPNNSI